LAGCATTMVPVIGLRLSWKHGYDPLFAEGTVGATLISLGGHVVRVHKDFDNGVARTAISYRDILPMNFAPLLILDASGSLRVTYKAWAKGRGGLVQLPSLGKTYRNLTIYHWDHPAGKAAYRSNKKQDEFARAVVSAVRSIPPDEPVLIILRLYEKP